MKRIIGIGLVSLPLVTLAAVFGALLGWRDGLMLLASGSVVLSIGVHLITA